MSLVPNFTAPGWAFSGCGPADPPLVSTGSGSGRAIFDLGALAPGIYSYDLTVDETDGNTGFVVTVGGVDAFPLGSDAPGSFSGSIIVSDPPLDHLVRLQSNMNGYKVSLFRISGPN